jgi:hypothetical protein
MIGVKVSILTNPDVKPSQQPHYQVPYHLIPGTKEKLQELISNEILEKVDENTKVTWISPMLPVQKSAQKGKRNWNSINWNWMRHQKYLQQSSDRGVCTDIVV